MQKSQWIWFDGKLVPWENAKTHVLSHTLHYGGGAFEGIRFYKTESGVAIFRLKEHVERLLYSCKAIELALPYSCEELMEAIKLTVVENKLTQGYIRPLAFWGEGDLRVAAKNLPAHFIVACWPLTQYLSSDSADVKISDFIRIHPKSTITDAKLCGHYVNSIIAGLAIKNTPYHESLLLDFEGCIAEGPGENFFCVIDGVVHTPPLGRILNGITRSTVLELMDDLKIPYKESLITLEQALTSQEAFFTGTAVELTPIRSINDVVFNQGEVGALTHQIKEAFLNVIYGRSKSYLHYLTYI